MKYCIVFSFCLIGYVSYSQQVPLKILCPLQNAIIIPPDTSGFHYSTPEKNIVLKSATDSVVKAGNDLLVTNIERMEDGRYGVVAFTKINRKDYYFWYRGIDNVKIKKQERIKAGQAIGTLAFGNQLELLVYDFETPLDPVPLMDCGWK